MTAFAKQCWQVWRTWMNWPVFRVLFLVMLAQWAVQLSELFLDRVWLNLGVERSMGYYLSAASFLVNLLPVLLAVAVPIMIFGRIKNQMASWRSALTPNHRIPHLLVGYVIGAAVFLLMSVLPAAISLWNDYYRVEYPIFPLSQDRMVFSLIPYHVNFTEFMVNIASPAIGTLAWVLFAATLIGWLIATVAACVVLPAISLAIALFMLYLAQTYHGLRISSLSLVWEVNHDPTLILELFFCDALLLIGLWLRLAHMPVAWESVSADERVPWLSGMLVKSKSLSPGTWTRSGLWRRAGHRRLMGLGRRFVWLVTIYSTSLIVLTTNIYRMPIDADAVSGEFAFGAFFLVGVVSILAIGLSWPRHFAELNEVELMRPAPRADCAREIGLAMLFDAAELCFAMTLAVVAISQYWQPQSLHYPAFWNLFIAAILAQILTFGLLVWCMLLRGPAAPIIGLAVAVIAFTMLLDLAVTDRTIIPAIAAAALGISLTAHAYRRWLRADMV